jgi:hypothetical protein
MTASIKIFRCIGIYMGGPAGSRLPSELFSGSEDPLSILQKRIDIGKYRGDIGGYTRH